MDGRWHAWGVVSVGLLASILGAACAGGVQRSEVLHDTSAEGAGERIAAGLVISVQHDGGTDVLLRVRSGETSSEAGTTIPGCFQSRDIFTMHETPDDWHVTVFELELQNQHSYWLDLKSEDSTEVVIGATAYWGRRVFADPSFEPECALQPGSATFRIECAVVTVDSAVVHVSRE